MVGKDGLEPWLPRYSDVPFRLRSLGCVLGGGRLGLLSALSGCGLRALEGLGRERLRIGDYCQSEA
jgi:hypothetical protein